MMKIRIDNEKCLTDDEIKKFKEIARKDYKVKLTNRQAFEQGAALVSFFEYLIVNRVKKL